MRHPGNILLSTSIEAFVFTVWLTLCAFVKFWFEEVVQYQNVPACFHCNFSKNMGQSPQNLPGLCEVDVGEAVFDWFRISNISSNISDPPHSNIVSAKTIFAVMRDQFIDNHHF